MTALKLAKTKKDITVTVSNARWPTLLQDKNDLFSPIYDHTLPNTSQLHRIPTSVSLAAQVYVIIMQPSNGFPW